MSSLFIHPAMGITGLTQFLHTLVGGPKKNVFQTIAREDEKEYMIPECDVYIMDLMSMSYLISDVTGSQFFYFCMKPLQQFFDKKRNPTYKAFVFVDDKSKYIPYEKKETQDQRRRDTVPYHPYSIISREGIMAPADPDEWDENKITEYTAPQKIDTRRLMHSNLRLRRRLFAFVVEEFLYWSKRNLPEDAYVVFDLDYMGNEEAKIMDWQGTRPTLSPIPLEHKIGEADLSMIYHAKNAHKYPCEKLKDKSAELLKIVFQTRDQDLIPLLYFHFSDDALVTPIWLYDKNKIMDFKHFRAVTKHWSSSIFMGLCILSGTDFLKKKNATYQIGLATIFTPLTNDFYKTLWISGTFTYMDMNLRNMLAAIYAAQMKQRYRSFLEENPAERNCINIMVNASAYSNKLDPPLDRSKYDHLFKCFQFNFNYWLSLQDHLKEVHPPKPRLGPIESKADVSDLELDRPLSPNLMSVDEAKEALMEASKRMRV